jgi:ubiquitin
MIGREKTQAEQLRENYERALLFLLRNVQFEHVWFEITRY